MNPKGISLVIGAVLIISGCARQNPVGPAPFNVGFFVLDILKKDGTTLTVAVWYPTTEVPEAYQYMNPHKTIGKLAYEGEPDRERGPYPLLVYSHGYGGGAYAGIYVAEHLASHGFVVAAPDHDDAFAVMRIDGGGDRDMQEYFRSAVDLGRSGTDFDRKAHAYRPEDVSLVIDEMLYLNRTESLLQGVLDEHAIGGIGHSLGGYTMLMVGGIDKEHYDSRITALLLYSAGVFMFEDEEYYSITVPVMFMYGEREGSEVRATLVNEKAVDTERAYENCQPPKFLLAIKGANHFSFGQSVFQDQWPGLGAKEGQKQADVICTYSLAFFEYYLKGDSEAETILRNEDEMVALYRNEMNQAF
jgi:predicted dienelactone hydrolase